MSDSDSVTFWSKKIAPGASPVRIHLIGVAGSGMSGLASLFLDLGHRVSGSDRVNSGETTRLQENGLIFSSPHTAAAVEDCEVVVYSSAVKKGRNPAFDAALAAGIPVLRRAEALAAIMMGNRGIVVGGTHGKTTTSALAAHLLRVGGRNPSHYVGAEIPILGRNALWDEQGEWFVAEGDESDGTLVNFHPEHAILLNVEAEHLDHYEGGIDEILEVFGTFCDQTSGKIFYCGNDPYANRVCRDRKNAVSYGIGGQVNFQAVDLEPKGAGTEFTVLHDGAELGRLRLGIPGQHNVLNALAAIALGVELGVSFDQIDEALSGFRGAKRRFEIIRQGDPFTIVDDYGHHPTEIKATLETARSLHAGRLLCLFQPHRFSRTKLLRDEFGASFHGVDELWVTDIYPASEPPLEGITGQTIVDAVGEHGNVAFARNHPDLKTLHHEIGRRLQPGDWILTLGAGNIHEVGTRLNRDLDQLVKLQNALAESDGGIRLYESMRKHTTIKAGGPAQFWVEPTTISGFARLIKHCNDTGLPLRVIGRGSNLLIRDGGIPGVVATPVKGDFGRLEVLDEQTIVAGAGVKFKALASAAQNAGIGGFEWMEGVPGAVGGSLRMNAGAMGSETFDQVVNVTMIGADGEVFERSKEEIVHHYRNVPELVHNIAVSAVFRGQASSVQEIEAKMESSKEKRKSSQPVAASAGCAFKNPLPDLGAGQLVDELGLKNSSVGKARVSEVHGNFIVNEGGSASDILALIAKIQATAKKERGIDLETEVQIIGRDEPV